jgi:hypothetical protein
MKTNAAVGTTIEKIALTVGEIVEFSTTCALLKKGLVTCNSE